MRSFIDSKPVGNNLENVELFTTKIDIFYHVLVKCLIMRIKVLFIASAVYLSSDITRDTIIFSVKQLGLRLVVLLKIMVSPVLYQTIDTRQLLKTIPLFSNYSCYFQVSGYLNWLVRNAADIEMQMNAVERVKYYSNIHNEQYEGRLNPRSNMAPRFRNLYYQMCCHVYIIW